MTKTHITSINVEDIFKDNFVDYGKEVIKNRALPDIRDGQKPVQRNSLYEFFESNATSKRQPVKIARLSGSIIGKWHPHGDKAVEEAIVKMSQEWKNTVPLIYIKGNNGSIYGDPAAAGRYIEGRTTPAGDTLGELLGPDIVPYEYNYDDSEQLPSILPAQIPVLLLNGATGIAVGQTCYIPTHNAAEVMDTVIAYIRNPKIKTEELMTILKGPDFPTGGVIINQDELLQTYATGKGRIRVRGEMNYNKSEHAWHIFEVPFTKSGSVESLIEDITLASMENVDKKGNKKPAKIPGIAQVENHSGKNGIDIKVSLKAGVDPEEIRNQLFARTGLEDTLPFEFKALNGKRLKRYTLKMYLREYVEYQQSLLIAKYKRNKLAIENRIEILTGRIILQNVMNEVIACAKLSNGKSHLETILMTGEKPKGLKREYHKTVSSFRFTERQAKDIASLPIHRISKMDMQEIVEEGNKLQRELANTISMIESDLRRKNEIIKHHELTKSIYNEPRRTRICNEAFAKASAIEVTETPLYISKDEYNYIRISEKPFDGAIITTNKSRLGILSTDGKMWNIHLENTKPTSGRGTLVNELLPGVEPVGMLTLPSENTALFVYSNGHIKQSKISDYMTATKAKSVKSGKLKDGVTLVSCIEIPSECNTIKIDNKSFKVSDIPVQGKSANGVKRLPPKDSYDIQLDYEPNQDIKDINVTESDDTPNAWCIFSEDGTLSFDWDMLGAKPEGLYVTDYQSLLTEELIFVHTDGTAKRVDGSQFEVKTKRTSIKADKDGMTIMYLAPVSETLEATFDTNTMKRINVSDISKQGKTGGGVRAFYHPKHKLVSVSDGNNSTLPIVTLATQPKPV